MRFIGQVLSSCSTQYRTRSIALLSGILAHSKTRAYLGRHLGHSRPLKVRLSLVVSTSKVVRSGIMITAL